MRAFSSRLIVLALLLEALYLQLASLARVGHHGATIGVLLVCGVVYLAAVRLARVHSESGTQHIKIIIAFAVLFRITLLPLNFPTTDDAFRYRWEGKLQAHGGNPYQVRPSDPEWAHLADSAYSRVRLREFKAGYGPAWEVVSHATYRLGASAGGDAARQVFWFKVPAALADLAILAVLGALLRTRKLPRVALVVYAWSPMPVWEFWANGHNDSLPVLCVVAACLAGRREKWNWAAGLLGLGAAFKWWPLLLLPLFVWRQLREGTGSGVVVRRWVKAGSSVATGLAVPFMCFLPFWSPVLENAQFMSGFVGGWRNNDSLYGAILWAAGDVYLAKYLSWGLVMVIVGGVAVSRITLERSVLFTLAGTLLVSSNCHPWYMTWLLPMLAVEMSVPLLLWTVAMPLGYSVWSDWSRSGVWRGSTEIRWWIYGPVAGAAAAQLLYGTSRRFTKAGP